MLFDLRVTERDGWAVVAVLGELDVASAPRLRQEMVSLASNGRALVVLDLHGVDFLDSTGLGVIVGALKRLRGLGGDLRLVGGAPTVRKVFELTGLDAVLGLHDSIDSAIADRGPEDG